MKPAVALISLGCAKNLVDSEIMLGSLRTAGFKIVDDPTAARVLIINTCSFINDAKKESIDAIKEASESKHKRRMRLIVSGCLAQRYRTELPKLMPEVDAFIGLDQVAEAGRIVTELLASEPTDTPASFITTQPKYIPDYGTPHVRLTPSHMAYVKIAEGCNHMCSFCAIPHIRGRHRSRPQSDIVAEVKALVAEGVKEINLVSQDSSFYGMDKWTTARATRSTGVTNAHGESLVSLLTALNALSGDFWIRPLYTHPAHWSDELIAAWGSLSKVVKYVDMPLQHISDPMLKAMKRETSKAHILGLLRRMRAGIPDLFIRSNFIVGFSGETQKDFDELHSFVSSHGIERGAVFEYSKEEDTSAFDLIGAVHTSTRRKRRNQLTEALFNTAQAAGDTLVGRRIRVLVEAPGIARTQWDAPEVDGSVEVPARLKVGQFADVTVEDCVGYQLFGK